MRTQAKMARAWGKEPRHPFKGERNKALGVPYTLLTAVSRGIYNALFLHLPNGVGIGLPYIVHHEDDPRGVVSTFEFEGERYEVVVRRGSADAYPTGVEDAAGLRAHMKAE
jgi:hypothetical protein